MFPFIPPCFHLSAYSLEDYKTLCTNMKYFPKYTKNTNLKSTGIRYLYIKINSSKNQHIGIENNVLPIKRQRTDSMEMTAIKADVMREYFNFEIKYSSNSAKKISYPLLFKIGILNLLQWIQ